MNTQREKESTGREVMDAALLAAQHDTLMAQEMRPDHR